MQHPAGKPNDDWADEHLHGHVRKLVILHWSKLPAIHAKEVSERIDLQREEDEPEQHDWDLNVETNANVEIKQCQKNNDEERVECKREITHLREEGCAREE